MVREVLVAIRDVLAKITREVEYLSPEETDFDLLGDKLKAGLSTLVEASQSLQSKVSASSNRDSVSNSNKTSEIRQWKVSRETQAKQSDQLQDPASANIIGDLASKHFLAEGFGLRVLQGHVSSTETNNFSDVGVKLAEFFEQNKYVHQLKEVSLGSWYSPDHKIIGLNLLIGVGETSELVLVIKDCPTIPYHCDAWRIEPRYLGKYHNSTRNIIELTPGNSLLRFAFIGQDHRLYTTELPREYEAILTAKDRTMPTVNLGEFFTWVETSNPQGISLEEKHYPEPPPLSGIAKVVQKLRDNLRNIRGLEADFLTEYNHCIYSLSTTGALSASSPQTNGPAKTYFEVKKSLKMNKPGFAFTAIGAGFETLATTAFDPSSRVCCLSIFTPDLLMVTSEEFASEYPIHAIKILFYKLVRLVVTLDYGFNIRYWIVYNGKLQQVQGKYTNYDDVFTKLVAEPMKEESDDDIGFGLFD